MDDVTQTNGDEAPAVAATVDNQTSEADVQTNEVAPEATQQSEGTAEIKATETAEDKLYAGKYKSVEELEKAYKNASSEASRIAQDKAELSRILNESFAEPEPQVQAQADPYAVEPDPINNEIENLKRVTAVQSFIMSHEGADAGAMQEVLNSDPLVKQIQGHEAKLEYAFLRSQNMSQKKAVAEATNNAVQSTKAKIVEKQTAQVESSKVTEQVDEKSELKNKFTQGSYEDRENARRQYIRKYLI